MTVAFVQMVAIRFAREPWSLRRGAAAIMTMVAITMAGVINAVCELV